jgi:hypothetical protein
MKIPLERRKNRWDDNIEFTLNSQSAKVWNPMAYFISLNRFLVVYNFAVSLLKSHKTTWESLKGLQWKVYEELLSRFHLYLERVIVMNTLHKDLQAFLCASRK